MVIHTFFKSLHKFNLILIPIWEDVSNPDSKSLVTNKILMKRKKKKRKKLISNLNCFFIPRYSYRIFNECFNLSHSAMIKICRQH